MTPVTGAAESCPEMEVELRMPRDGSGIYSKAAGTTAVSGQTIESAKYNSQVDDMVADLNAARPIVAGGTGATSVAAAQANLGLIAGTAGYIFGLTLSNNGSDATNDIDIAAGVAAETATSPVLMTLAAALTKRLDASWAVGTNQGGLDTGSIANGTYHVWIIARSDTGVVDALFSTSATSPTMPANYDRKRRIGSILRESATIIPFEQKGDTFKRVAINSYASTSALASTLTAFNVPNSIIVQPIIAIYISPAASSNIYIALGSASRGLADIVVTQSRTDAGGVTETRGFIASGFYTNTVQQLYLQHNIVSGTASTNTLVQTIGWVDDRGRLA